jgi:protein SCO1/2
VRLARTVEVPSQARTAPGDDRQSFAPTERSLRKRDVASLLVLVAVVGLIASLGVSDGPAKLALPGNASSTHTSRFAGATLAPANLAPALSLRNYLGERIDISDYRGRVVLVTFLYTHCLDLCPLTASKLHEALLRMPAGEASRVATVAVSVDPRGDDRATVTAFLRAHEMTGRMSYLVGSASELGRTWAAWRVGSRRERANPSAVAHSALVYGISASGRLMTIYPASFDPAEIVHDVPRLAAS